MLSKEEVGEEEVDVFETRRITLDHVATPTKLLWNTPVERQSIESSGKGKGSKIPTPSKKRSSINQSMKSGMTITPQGHPSQTACTRMSMPVYPVISETSSTMQIAEEDDVNHQMLEEGRMSSISMKSNEIDSNAASMDIEKGNMTPLKQLSVSFEGVANNFGFKYPAPENDVNNLTLMNSASIESIKGKTPQIGRVSSAELAAKSPLVLHEPIHVNELCNDDNNGMHNDGG